jgi:hypothetical protein
VAGMATLFSGAYVATIVMASALEASKVISAAWLKTNWHLASRFLKVYLTTTVVVLSCITSMGTFGYLSKAHLEQQSQLNLSSLQLQPLQDQIDLEQRKLKNAQTSLDTLDHLANTSDPKDAVTVRGRQKRERQYLNTELNDSTRKLEVLNAKVLPLRTKQAITTADIGPLKYIAELIYGADAEQHFDQAVRFVIISIVIVFDPLAIVLLLAATTGLTVLEEEPDPVKPKRKRGVVEIPESTIMNFVK